MTHTLRGSHLALVAALAVGLSCSPLIAQYGQNGSSPSSSQSSAAAHPAASANPNQRAVTLMNTINKGEIASADAIENKAQSAKVRDFAKMLKSDHQGAESDLRDIASSDRLTLSVNHHMSSRNHKMMERIQGMPGNEADTAYLKAEARDHARAIHMLNRLESKVNDPNLRKYITEKYLPLLHKHEQKADQTLAELGGNPASQPAGQANPHHNHLPYDLPAYAQSGQNGGAQNGTPKTQNGQKTTPATPPPAAPNANPQAPAGAPPAAAAQPSSKAGQHQMPKTASPLGLLILAGAGLTGLGLGAKRGKNHKK